MMLPFLDHLARAGSAGLADAMVLGFVIAAIAWAMLGLLRKHRAATRFAVLASALTSIAILPALRALARGHAGSAATPLIHLGDTWAACLAAFWMIGATAGLIRVAVGLISLGHLRRNCRALAISPELQTLVDEFCPSRRVQLLASDTVAAPCAIGYFHPAVILPGWLMDELSPAELRHVIIHEFSHLRRRDDWTNLLQRILQALFFFHPAVWWLEGRLSLEREMACDDAVLAHSDSPRAYAECLAHLAEKSVLRRGLALAQAAVSRMQETSARVTRILRFDSKVRGGKFAVSLATVFALTGFGALLNAPTLVSFSTPSASRSFSRPLLARKDQVIPHAVNASWKMHTHAPATLEHVEAPPAIAHAIPAVVKHPRAETRMARASLRPSSPREVTYFLVVQGQNTLTIVRISTWQFVPSQQIRADRKTT
jgi:beta-lactamase regulating signal transducer with metallopeptidase domain